MAKKPKDLKRDTPKCPNKQLELTLGIPLSINHMYVNTRGGGKRLSKKAEDYVRCARAQINLAIEEQGWRKCYEDIWYYLDIVMYMPDLRVRDSHNTLKLLLDTMEGLAFENDYFVMPNIQAVEYDKLNPRIEVILRPQKESERKKVLQKFA